MSPRALRALKLACGVLTVLLVVAAVACTLGAIWTGDLRWWATTVVAVVMAFIAGGTALTDTKAKS